MRKIIPGNQSGGHLEHMPIYILIIIDLFVRKQIRMIYG